MPGDAGTAAAPATPAQLWPSWLTAGLASASVVAFAAAGYYSRRLAASRGQRTDATRQASAGASSSSAAQAGSWFHLLLLGPAHGAAQPPEPAAAPRHLQQQQHQHQHQHQPGGGGQAAEGRGGQGGEVGGAEARPMGAERQRPLEHASSGWLAEMEEEEKDGQEVPEAFADPITFAAMHDPVVLCGTGQVYNYSSLRAWLSTGQRKCPKTNLALVDIEVVRLPLLRHAIHAWMEQHGLPIPQPEATPEALAAADPRCPGWAADLRCGDVARRGIQAAAKINDTLIEWGRDTTAGEEVRQLRAAAMEHFIDDLVWLLRHGDQYGQGVACAALSQYPSEEHRQWLAAVAAVPACGLLASPNEYARHSAARLIAVLAHVHPIITPGVLVGAGAVPGLLAQVDLSRTFAYTRCSAASALAGIAASSEGGGREAIRAGGGVELLLGLVTQQEGQQGVAGRNEHLVRFDKRDAASALLALGVTEEELQGRGVTLAQLQAYKKCSHAWLSGQVEQPEEGYTPAEEAQLQQEQAEEPEEAERDAAAAEWGEEEGAAEGDAEGDDAAGAAGEGGGLGAD